MIAGPISHFPDMPAKCRGLLALVLVVAAGSFVDWLFMGEKGEQADREPAKPSKIVEVNPQVMTKNVEFR